MNAVRFCTQCGNKIEPGVKFCANCGTKVGTVTPPTPTIAIPEATPATLSHKKSGSTALILCILLGMLGAHRFYVGKWGTGFLMLCTGGILGVWVIIDLTSIARNKFEDKNGEPLELIHDVTPMKETLLITGSVMLWVALFFASIAVFLNYSSSSLVTVAQNQLTALHEGRLGDAYYYTTSSYQNRNSIEVFKNFVDAYPVLMNATISSFPERQITRNKGFMRGYLENEEGVKTPVAYEMLKENGQWKILNIQIVLPVKATGK